MFCEAINRVGSTKHGYLLNVECKALQCDWGWFYVCQLLVVLKKLKGANFIMTGVGNFTRQWVNCIDEVWQLVEYDIRVLLHTANKPKKTNPTTCPLNMWCFTSFECIPFRWSTISGRSQSRGCRSRGLRPTDLPGGWQSYTLHILGQGGLRGLPGQQGSLWHRHGWRVRFRCVHLYGACYRLPR